MGILILNNGGWWFRITCIEGAPEGFYYEKAYGPYQLTGEFVCPILELHTESWDPWPGSFAWAAKASFLEIARFSSSWDHCGHQGGRDALSTSPLHY